MKTHTTIKNWARATNARVTRFKQDHTLDSRYPDVVPTVHLELTLDADKRGRRPHLRIWIPLARRTPLLVFGPDAAQPATVEVEATFPSFENEGELTAALDMVLADFLEHYRPRQPMGRSRLPKGRVRKSRQVSQDRPHSSPRRDMTPSMLA